MMRDLTIRFIFDEGLTSRLIGWNTDSLWSHTEALSRDGQSWIGAHMGSGVQSLPLDYCKPVRERRYAVPVLDRAADAAYAWLTGKIGTPYNVTDIIGLALHARIGVTNHEVICSSLMLQFMQQAGLEPLNCLSEYSALITPETLHLSPLFIGRCVYKSD